jgi:transcriptional regulator with XRE-family HTH domain
MTEGDEFARRLRAARAYGGVSQAQLGAALGVSEATIKRIETGQTQPGDLMRRAYAQAAAEHCGLPVTFFLVDFATLRVGGEAMAPASAASTIAALDRIEEELALARHALVGILPSEVLAVTGLGEGLASAAAADAASKTGRKANGDDPQGAGDKERPSTRKPRRAQGGGGRRRPAR